MRAQLYVSKIAEIGFGMDCSSLVGTMMYDRLYDSDPVGFIADVRGGEVVMCLFVPLDRPGLDPKDVVREELSDEEFSDILFYVEGKDGGRLSSKLGLPALVHDAVDEFPVAFNRGTGVGENVLLTVEKI